MTFLEEIDEQEEMNLYTSPNRSSLASSLRGSITTRNSDAREGSFKLRLSKMLKVSCEEDQEAQLEDSFEERKKKTLQEESPDSMPEKVIETEVVEDLDKKEDERYVDMFKFIDEGEEEDIDPDQLQLP